MADEYNNNEVTKTVAGDELIEFLGTKGFTRNDSLKFTLIIEKMIKEMIDDSCFYGQIDERISQLIDNYNDHRNGWDD